MSILNRKLAIIFIGFTMGVFLYQYSHFITLLLLPLSLVALKFWGKKAIALIIASIMFFLGGFYTCQSEKINLSKTAPLTEETLEFDGTIISIPEKESYGESAVCITEYGKIRLMTRDASLNYKDNVTFKAKCYYPDEKSRPFAFDYPLYLKSEGIYLLAFAEELSVNGNSASLFNPVDAVTLLRATLLEKTTTLWSGESLMFSRAILLGDSSLSSGEFREKLSSGSISHIIAVSGTHVSFVSLLFMLLIGKFSKRKRYLNLLAIPFIAAFVILTGASPSCIRAAVMLILYLIAKSFLFNYDGITSLAFAAFAILIFNPFTAFSLSFILSFSAVLGILIYAKPISDALSFIKLPFISNILAVTLSAQIFTMITLCFSFGRIPFTALIANIVAIPLVPLIMAFGYLTLVLSFMTPLSDILALITEVVMSLCITIADFSGKLPLANIYPVFSSPRLFISVFIFLILTITFLVLYKSKKLSAIFLCLFILSLILNTKLPYIKGEKSFYFMDSGHGDASLAFNKSTALMIECLSPETDFVKDSLIPVLRQHGQSDLDAVFLTEYDSYNEDVSELISSFPVKAVYLPKGSDAKELSSLAKKQDTKLVFVTEGDSFTIDEITVKAVFSHDGFCSYIIENEKTELLIPGNIPEKAEALLAEKITSVDMLKAPRHGNKGSCSENLLKLIKSDCIFVSTGRKLSDDFSKRLSANQVYSTKTGGDITVNCKTKEINPYKKVK